MQRSQTLNPLTLSRNNKQSKSLGNFILLNRNRQVESRHQWKPLQTTERIMRRTNSINREISFGGSYSNKKSILLTLNKDKSSQKINVPVQQLKTLNKKQETINKQRQADNIIRSKLNLIQGQGDKMTNLKNSLKTFNISSQPNKHKIQSKFSKFTNTTAEFNRKVEDNLTRVRINSFRLRESSKTLTQRESQNNNKLRNSNDFENKRMVGIITAKRYGLRIRLKHVITSLCVCNKASHQNSHNFQKNKRVLSLVNDMFELPQQIDKTFYYFRLNKDPIVSINDLPSYQNVILALLSPVFNVENQNYLGLCQQAERLSKHVRQTQDQITNNQNASEQRLNQTQRTKKSFTYMSPKKKSKLAKKGSQQNNDTNDDEQTKYDWQLIPDIHAYIQKIVQNPQLVKNQSIKSGITFNPSQKNQILQLYKQKFDNQTKIQTGQNFRNPLLEDHSHYHVQLREKKLLNKISSHLSEYDFIKNTHQIKRLSIYELQQQAKQQKLLQLHEQMNPDIINRNIESTLQSKKSLIRQLDSKNTLLFQQNIPYMMNKYGISRYEIHNLFTIYKTLQKISAIKLLNNNNAKKVLSKGIDRGTFDEGMKRLDINPGDQVIKNICYFDDFISWQQFIKIVSIGLRKTPQEKLQAILSGIGGTSNGQLNKKQISIMIGNSLTKIFDSDQVELREYFTNVAMRDLDSDNSGFVDIEEIKKKCLTVANKKGENQNIDLVTFLLLNS